MNDLPTTSGIEVIREALQTMPTTPGVYRMLAEDGTVLYVGKAKQLRNRVSSYTRPASLTTRIQRMISRTARMEITQTRSEAEALLLEANLIKKLEPYYNILLKDDKTYPHILITGGHDFPRVVKHRGAQKQEGEYFGPFASAGAVSQTINLLQRAFLLRPCSDSYFANRSRPCLEFQIKRCSAPCTGEISQQAYAELVLEARDFLTGKTRALQERLTKQMQEASESMDYERAAVLRDRIQALTTIQQQNHAMFSGIQDADIIAVVREGAMCCVQVFFVRGGQYFGCRSFYPRHTDEVSMDAVIAAFVGQYYQQHEAPAELLLSHDCDEQEVLEEALSDKEGRRVRLHHPQRGEKRTAVQHALRQTQEVLSRHLAVTASTHIILEEVAKLFGLEEAPQRIEVYDNSHIMGSHAVGGMITATTEGFDKSAYRKFNFKGDIEPGDDYGMMREMLTRRFSYLVPSEGEGAKAKEKSAFHLKPDLVLIDGGLGQLGVACEVMEELGLHDIVLVGVAKGPDRNAGREQFFLPGKQPFTLPPESAVLHYLQRLRDEAHHFAITSHRKKRTKAISANRLDEVPGIGARRKKALLLHFGSAKAVEEAGLEDLEAVPGISQALAEDIHAWFRS